VPTSASDRRRLPQARRPVCDYLFVALHSYAIEGKPQVGRANPIMGAQVKQFKRAELKAIADYLGSLPGELRTVPQSKFR